MSRAADWKRGGFTFLLLVTTALLVLGLTLPSLRTESVLSSSAHSILGGIKDSFVTGNIFLGLVILCFSVIFPTLKLFTLVVIWTRDVDQDEEEKKILWLAVLGKWSMLDVWVVAIFVGAVRLGVLAGFEAEPGIYVFAGAILGTMVCTFVMERAKGYRPKLPDLEDPRRRSLLGRALNAAAIVSFAVGISTPMMEVEKLVFWSSEYSLLGALRSLWKEDQIALALMLAFFVLLVPAIHLVGLALLRWVEDLPQRLRRAVVFLEEWAMLDVFALALLVVVAQLSGMASLTPRIGLLSLLVASALVTLDSRLLRR